MHMLVSNEDNHEAFLVLVGIVPEYAAAAAFLPIIILFLNCIRLRIVMLVVVVHMRFLNHPGRGRHRESALFIVDRLVRGIASCRLLRGHASG